MRTIVATALTGLMLASTTGAPASAEPTAPPEAPPSGLVFTDNPAIVDPHPLRIESWSRLADDDAVAVNFTSGTETCYGVHAAVHETEEAVTVDLRGGTLPEAVDKACIMIAVFGTLEVALHAPLGDRRVFSTS